MFFACSSCTSLYVFFHLHAVCCSPLPSNKDEPQSPIPEAPTSSKKLLSPENLPSTERSESILHLKRSKSESSLSARTLDLVGTPWNKLILQKSPVELSPEPAPGSPTREATTPHIDNTLSLQTDLEDDDEVENVQESRTEKCGYQRFKFFKIFLYKFCLLKYYK